tara:strand:+ start:109 stop:411 length:303 start_codon:yes stop_codon:yes gene_type:complete
MSIIELYLLNENNIIVDNIKKLNNYLNNNDNIINNKLIQKKIEYINFYMKNINEELNDINNICETELFLNEEYINYEYKKYVNMETTIKNYQLNQLIHNL